MRHFFETSMIYENFMFFTHWSRDKMAAIFQTTFSNGFSWMKMYEFRLTFHWSLFLRPINNIPILVQVMAWHRPGDKPEPMVVRLPTHICVKLGHNLDFRLLYQDCAHGSPAWFIIRRYSNGKRKKATMPLWWLHHFDFLHWRWLHALMTMVASASGLFVIHKTEKKSCPHIWLAKFKNSSNTEIFDSTKPVTCIEQSN